MADIYLNSKPVTANFSYAYVEDPDGKVKRISLENLKMLLGVGYVEGVITVLADNWIASDDGTYYTQEVTMPNITNISKIEWDATPEQLIQLMQESISMFVGNNQGVVTVFAYNGIPSTDMVIKVRITEEAAI